MDQCNSLSGIGLGLSVISTSLSAYQYSQ